MTALVGCFNDIVTGDSRSATPTARPEEARGEALGFHRGARASPERAVLAIVNCRLRNAAPFGAMRCHLEHYPRASPWPFSGRAVGATARRHGRLLVGRHASSGNDIAETAY
jgi:hypothetical protein